MFFSNNNSFGLDISANSVKVLALDKKGKEFKIEGYSHNALPKGVLLNDQIMDEKTFLYVLNEALTHPQFGRFHNKFVVASLPESKSFVRVIQVPLMSDAEIENAVPFESENFIPMPVDQVYIDWQKISIVGDKINILIIATPKEFVEKFLTVLDKAGLKATGLMVESQCCNKALMPASSEETVLIVDLQAARTNLIMVENGQLQFTSSVPIAGNAFTESIARNLGISSAKAEEIKRKIGITNTSEYPNVKTALLPVLNNLSSEIKNVLRFHGEHSEKQVQKIVLSGGSAKLKSIVEYLDLNLKDTGAKVVLGDPWVNIGEIKNNPLADESLSFTKAVGLALSGLENI